MAVKISDIPAILVERIEAAYPAPGHFSAIEIDDWPARALPHLLNTGVLQVADRAEAIVCPGCEWQCHKAVVVRTVGPRSTSRALINCDEEPAHGRVPVPMRNLTRYRATLSSISSCIAVLMKVEPLRTATTNKWVPLWNIKGRYGNRPVSIGLNDGRLQFRVGQKYEPALHLLRWSDAGLAIDSAHLRRLADRKAPAEPTGRVRPHARPKQQELSRNKRARDEYIYRDAKRRYDNREGTWTEIARVIAATKLAVDEQDKQLDETTVRRIITEKRRLERQAPRSKRKICK